MSVESVPFLSGGPALCWGGARSLRGFWSCCSTAAALTSRATPPGDLVTASLSVLPRVGVGGPPRGPAEDHPDPQGGRPVLCTAFCLHSNQSDAKVETGQLLRAI